MLAVYGFFVHDLHLRFFYEFLPSNIYHLCFPTKANPSDYAYYETEKYGSKQFWVSSQMFHRSNRVMLLLIMNPLSNLYVLKLMTNSLTDHPKNIDAAICLWV